MLAQRSSFRSATRGNSVRHVNARRSSFVAAALVPHGKKQAAGSSTNVAENFTPSAAWVAAASAFVAPLTIFVGEASAKDGAFGILEGRTAALVHPAFMIFLFGSTLYSGFLGWQWRRTRTIVDDIKALKAQLPAAAEDGTRPASPLDGQIASLEKERKDLLAGGFRDKHYAWGALILSLGTLIAVEGCVNTFMRTDRLFPGPHLFAGAGLVVLWAAAAALVPAMQKGNENARSAHIALNVLNVGLFAWQLPTGFEIVDKVFQFTSWP